jgi:hypothetical protein
VLVLGVVCSALYIVSELKVGRSCKGYRLASTGVHPRLRHGPTTPAGSESFQHRLSVGLSTSTTGGARFQILRIELMLPQQGSDTIRIPKMDCCPLLGGAMRSGHTLWTSGISVTDPPNTLLLASTGADGIHCGCNPESWPRNCRSQR